MQTEKRKISCPYCNKSCLYKSMEGDPQTVLCLNCGQMFTTGEREPPPDAEDQKSRSSFKILDKDSR